MICSRVTIILRTVPLFSPPPLPPCLIGLPDGGQIHRRIGPLQICRARKVIGKLVPDQLGACPAAHRLDRARPAEIGKRAGFGWAEDERTDLAKIVAKRVLGINMAGPVAEDRRVRRDRGPEPGKIGVDPL